MSFAVIVVPGFPLIKGPSHVTTVDSVLTISCLITRHHGERIIGDVHCEWATEKVCERPMDMDRVLAWRERGQHEVESVGNSEVLHARAYVVSWVTGPRLPAQHEKGYFAGGLTACLGAYDAPGALVNCFE